MSDEQETPQSRLRVLFMILDLYASMAKFEHPKAEITLMLAARNPDGSGKGFNHFEYESFAADVKSLLGPEQSV